MAIVEMRKMSVVAHQSERNKLLRTFIKSGCVETVKSSPIDNTVYKKDEELKEQIESKLIRINFALTFLKDICNQAKRVDKDIASVSLKKENELVALEKYEAITKDEYELFNSISDLEEINKKLTDIKSKKQRINALKEQLSVYEALEIKFSDIKDTKRCHILAGTIPAQRAEQIQTQNDGKVFLRIYQGDKLCPIVAICLKEDGESVRSMLAANDFAKCPFEYDMTARQKLDELEQELKELEASRQSLALEAVGERQHVTKLKILYDFYLLEMKKVEVIESCSSSRKTFVIEGWVPKHKEEYVKELIDKNCKYALAVFRDAYKDETPPTLTKNNKLVDPIEGITNMFGVPSYREIDPNIFVAIFFFIIFGFMFSDAGYGVVLAVSCFLYCLIKKPVKKSGRMMLLFGLGGISTIIWGAVFGGWFGMTFPKEPLINPLDATGSLIMFGSALAIGALQIATGFAINGANKIRRKEYLDGILGDFSWVVIFLGLFLVTGGMLGAVKALTSAGAIVAAIGAAMLIISGALGKKNPIKMVGGALGKAYGSINVVSDLLSYSRLFGLGLTTGVIGYVVNQFAVVIVGFFPQSVSFIGWILSMPVLLVGHLFNFAINLLGVYVHNSRLQYIEFFGRFYEGTGHIFMPLGSNTKYTYLDN